MSRTKNRYKSNIEGNTLSVCNCDPNTPWKYGKLERNFQSNKNKGWRKMNKKKKKKYLEINVVREIKEIYRHENLDVLFLSDSFL